MQGVTETDIVNNLTYGAAGELKSMSWSDTGGWSTQNWTFNNRLQMTGYTYGGPGGRSTTATYFRRRRMMGSCGVGRIMCRVRWWSTNTIRYTG